MHYRPVLITAPAADPVTLEEVKAHLRVIERDESGAALPNEDDALITALIKAAVTHLDGWTGVLGRCLVNQTWRQDFGSFSQCMRLPLGPVQSIVSVKWRNTEGQIATVAADKYAVETSTGGQSTLWFRSSYTRPRNLYERAAVSVEFIAGYGAAADVPQAIKHAMLMLIGHWYQNAQAVVSAGSPAVLPLAVDALLTPYRRISI